MKKTRTQWLSKHLRESRKSENSGVAMIMVLIVGAVVLAFCLSLLLIAYSLFAQTSRQTGRQQCKLLAQSFSESLAQDLLDPSSSLSVYLSDQIQNGRWISLNASDPETLDPEAVTNLLLNLEDGGNMGAYHVTVELTYTQNVPNHEDVGTEDSDDSDTGSSQTQQLAESGEDEGGEEGADPAPVIVTYTVHVSIKCMRGDVSDRDVQYYVMETIYPSVSFSTTE